MRQETRDAEELISAFERCEVSDGDFRHADHVRMGWCYLQKWPVLEAIDRFSTGLRRFAISKGKPDLYHETITWAYIFLIHERMERMEPEDGWEEFAAANADLLTWEGGGVLRGYYSEERLRSEEARRLFVLPDAGLRDAGHQGPGLLPLQPSSVAVEGR